MLDCHMMLIPEETQNKLNHIIIPTDFTPNSAKSFEFAFNLQKQHKSQLLALHVFNIPSVYFPYIDRQKAIDKTQRHLDEKFNSFTKRFKLNETPFTHFYREDLSVVESIRRYARKNEANMIIMAAKGGNKLTSLFIGSITNDMLLQDFKMPVLIVR